MEVRIYKIHVFDEAFFLFTIRMPMITKLFQGDDMLQGEVLT